MDGRDKPGHDCGEAEWEKLLPGRGMAIASKFAKLLAK
jgi:hypothetical protein